MTYVTGHNSLARERCDASTLFAKFVTAVTGSV
jgi:hypothetical protein